MTGINIRAIILGIITDISATFFFIMVFVPLVGNGASVEAVDELITNTGPLFFFFIGGSLCTVLGGFVAATIGSLAPYKNSVFVGAFGLILGVLSAGSSPLWLTLSGFIITVPAALLGGYLAILRNASQDNVSE